jgi:hypothetical protein
LIRNFFDATKTQCFIEISCAQTRTSSTCNSPPAASATAGSPLLAALLFGRQTLAQQCGALGATWFLFLIRATHDASSVGFLRASQNMAGAIKQPAQLQYSRVQYHHSGESSKPLQNDKQM